MSETQAIEEALNRMVVKCRVRGCDWRSEHEPEFKARNAERVHHYRAHRLGVGQ